MTLNGYCKVIFSVVLGTLIVALVPTYAGVKGSYSNKYESELWHQELEDLNDCSNLLINSSTKDAYEVATERNDFRIVGSIDDRGGLGFDIVAEGRQKQRHPDFSGKDQFAAMVRHFRDSTLHSYRFTHILGKWSIRDDKSETDNLKLFNNAIAEGFTPQEAAVMTWTGQRAKEIGFGNAKIVTTFPEKLSPSQPRFEHVEVSFWPSEH